MSENAAERNERGYARLFVYGTLKSHSAHPMAKFLARHARLLCVGSCSGRLYDLGAYPGWVASPHADDRVHGEVWELEESPADVWAVIDEYEGCEAPPMLAAESIRSIDPASTCDREEQDCSAENETPLFRRMRQVVRGPGEVEQEVWIYAYCGSIVGRQRIASFEASMSSSEGE